MKTKIQLERKLETLKKQRVAVWLLFVKCDDPETKASMYHNSKMIDGGVKMLEYVLDVHKNLRGQIRASKKSTTKKAKRRRKTT